MPSLVHVFSVSIRTPLPYIIFFFFFNDTAPTEIYTLSLHDALPIYNISPSLSGHGLGGPDTGAAAAPLLMVCSFQFSQCCAGHGFISTQPCETSMHRSRH